MSSVGTAWREGVRWLASHQLLGVPDQLARVARSFVWHYDVRPDPYDIHTNGEQTLIERIVDEGSVVFDVGANVGDWSALAVQRGALVHSFEISPTTASTLADRFAHEDRVTIHPVGLSDHDGEVRLRHYPDAPFLSTTVTEYPHPHPSEEIVVPVTTGDRLTHALELTHIDLLKIDVEGAEPAVLRGFRSMLEAGAIDVIQFEYGLANAMVKFLVSDYYDLLEPLGYRLGPLTSEGVDFRDYDVRLERFRYVNWVAVGRDRVDLLAKLASGSLATASEP